jgi:AmiR/NasT family two-component response regulator
MVKAATTATLQAAIQPGTKAMTLRGIEAQDLFSKLQIARSNGVETLAVSHKAFFEWN